MSEVDWVGAHFSCSAAKTIASLKTEARALYEQYCRDAPPPLSMSLNLRETAEGFSLWRDSGPGFKVTRWGESIVAEPLGTSPALIEATLVVTDVAECKLSTNGIELSRAQFLRLLFEGVFFGPTGSIR